MQLPSIAYPKDEVLLDEGRKRFCQTQAAHNETRLHDLLCEIRSRCTQLGEFGELTDLHKTLDDLVATIVNAREKAKYSIACRAELKRLCDQERAS